MLRNDLTDEENNATWCLIGTLSCMLIRDISTIMSLTVQDSDIGPHFVIMFKHAPVHVAVPIPFRLFATFVQMHNTDEQATEQELEDRSTFMERNYQALYMAVSDREDRILEEKYGE